MDTDKLRGTAHTIALSGRFDAHEAPGFRTRFDAAVASGAREIALDLSAVQFIDSTALAELVRSSRELQRVGGALILREPSGPVRVILDVTGLHQVFDVRLAS